MGTDGVWMRQGGVFLCFILPCLIVVLSHDTCLLGILGEAIVRVSCTYREPTNAERNSGHVLSIQVGTQADQPGLDEMPV